MVRGNMYAATLPRADFSPVAIAHRGAGYVMSGTETRTVYVVLDRAGKLEVTAGKGSIQRRTGWQL
jgi:hypothetical protein